MPSLSKWEPVSDPHHISMALKEWESYRKVSMFKLTPLRVFSLNLKTNMKLSLKLLKGTTASWMISHWKSLSKIQIWDNWWKKICWKVWNSKKGCSSLRNQLKHHFQAQLVIWQSVSILSTVNHKNVQFKSSSMLYNLGIPNFLEQINSSWELSQVEEKILVPFNLSN